MFQFLSNLVYGTDPAQTMDLFLPEKTGAPLVVFIHGGGWRGGDKADYRPLGEVLAGFGYAVALPNHRLAPAHPHPAQVEDVAAAVACVQRYGEEAGVQTTGIWLGGHSSGAHLAALLALHPGYRAQASLKSEQIAGVICISGVYNLERYAPFAIDYLAAAFGRDPATYRDASPALQLRSGVPPFFLACAEFDIPGAEMQAREMAAAVEARGGIAQVVVVPNRTHITILTGITSLFDPLAVGLATFLRQKR